MARHEFILTVTRLGYVLTLVGMPLFLGALGGLSGMIASRAVTAQLGKERRIGVVDESKLFRAAPNRVMPQAQLRVPGLSKTEESAVLPAAQLLRFDDLPAARVALAAEQVDAVLRIPAAFVAEGKVEEYRRARKGIALAASLESPTRLLRGWLIAGLLQGKVDPLVAARVSTAPSVEAFVVDASGAAALEDPIRELRHFVVPLGFTLFLMLSIFTSGSYLATGLAEDKQNRALEMLLTSLTPEQLFRGKLLGLGAAALLQFILYLLAIALPAALLVTALGIHLGQALIGLCYFVLGFFFFGSVLLAIGSIGNSHKYTQQLSGLFTITAIVPIWMLPNLLSEPQGTLARVLTFIPFTAPLTGMLRAATGALPWWELLLSLLALALSAAVVIRGSSKIFRVALLSTGTTPSPAQLWAWLRA